jgi:putative monooxygenase
MSEHQPNPGAIFRRSDLRSYDRGGGARTTPMASGRCGSQKMMNGITSLPGGAAIPLHAHNCEETVLLLSGEAIAEIDGISNLLSPWDSTWIPPNVPHRFINASPTEQATIFWTYASVDATRTLISNGETQRVDAEHRSRVE